MTIGVVIPCRNEAAHVIELLDAIAAQHRPADDIVLVDDGSIDGSKELASDWRRRHTSVPLRVCAGPERGIAAAVNAGVAALRTDIVVRLDGHCRPDPEYLRGAVDALLEPGAGVVGGVWDIRPGAPTPSGRAIAIAVSHWFGSGGAAYRHADRATRGDVDTVPFGCMTRALWLELGGLDERLGANEDYEFNYRARHRGWRVVLDPAICCTYYARSTLGAVARQYGRYGWWKARMLVRHPASVRWRQFVPALLVPALMVCTLGAVLGTARVSWMCAWAVYPTTVCLVALHAATARRAWAELPWLVAAFFVIQLCWSGALWTSLAATMFMPPRRFGGS